MKEFCDVILNVHELFIILYDTVNEYSVTSSKIMILSQIIYLLIIDYVKVNILNYFLLSLQIYDISNIMEILFWIFMLNNLNFYHLYYYIVILMYYVLMILELIFMM